ncbi:MAG: putative ABC transporter permease [Eubacterium sp.]|nr:putative ABC transporter permease [Eubacterium sp.]
MIHYKTFQWLFFFYMYCFFGWCFESAYVSAKSRKLVNRGFMRGPFLPLYGSGAIMMLVVSMPFQDNVWLTYIAGVIGATALEYVTGVAMEALFKVRYWDYSNQPFNFQGHICLSSSLAWGFLTILMTRVIHRPIEQFVFAIPENVLFLITALLTVCIVADFTLSFKAALDLRDILIKMQKVREEMERMQRRLDVIIAFSNEEKEQKKQERELTLSELNLNLKQKFAGLKENIQLKPSAYGEGIREEIAELRGRFSHYPDPQKNYREMLDFYKRDMIRNNPTMVSRKFKVALEELKNIAGNRKE